MKYQHILLPTCKLRRKLRFSNAANAGQKDKVMLPQKLTQLTELFFPSEELGFSNGAGRIRHQIVRLRQRINQRRQCRHQFSDCLAPVLRVSAHFTLNEIDQLVLQWSRQRRDIGIFLYSLNAHSRCKLEYGENTREAVKNWWKLYQSAVEIYNSDSPTADCLTSGEITLNRLKQFDQENRSVVADSIYHPVTADAIRMTSDVQKAVVTTSEDDFLEIVKELAPKLREQRSNARLIFVRYLYYYIEGMMQYYCGWRKSNASIAAELFDHPVSSEESINQFIAQFKQGDYENLKISILGVIRRMYLYYKPVGDGIVSGISEDDTGDEEKNYLENEADYFTDVLRGTCDLTRERLLFFLTFVNSMLVRDSILPDFRDDIVLDENRLNSILERCYGVVLSNEKDTLAMRILQIQHENPSQNDIVRRKIDYSLYDLTQDVLERDDLADKKPMGPTTTNTYGGKLQKDIAGKPET